MMLKVTNYDLLHGSRVKKQSLNQQIYIKLLVLHGPQGSSLSYLYFSDLRLFQKLVFMMYNLKLLRSAAFR